MIWVALGVLVLGLFASRDQCEIDRIDEIARSTQPSEKRLRALIDKAHAEGRSFAQCPETQRAYDEHIRKLDCAIESLKVFDVPR